MAKPHLHVLRSREPSTGTPERPAVEVTADVDRGLIAEREIWGMAAFRLHDAATWMVRLATASGSSELRVQLLRIYDELIRSEQEILRLAEAESPGPDATEPRPVNGGQKCR